LPTSPFFAVAEHFLRWAKSNVSGKTYRSYSDNIASFCNESGKERVRDLKPFHVSRWLEKRTTWGPDAKRAAISAVKRCLNWSVAEGLIDRNPLTGVKKPRGCRRQILITEMQHTAMMLAEDGGRKPGKRAEMLDIKPRRRDAAFRAVLAALKHSGARPGMIASVRVEDVSEDGSAWILQQHKTKDKTGRPLIIYLSPCLATLSKIAAAGRTTGPLFLNSRGKAWTINAIRCRMKELRRKLDLPAGTVAYSYRHTYATTALMNGTDLATVAELLGHTDLKMISQHYGHLDLKKDHLKAAAARALTRQQPR
jgi:site-specific recombinase XerD